MKKAFLVQCPGYWGRGPTLKEAAQQVRKAGLTRNDYVIVDLVLGDDKPAITNNGMNISMAHDSEVIRIGTSFRLDALLNLDSEHTGELTIVEHSAIVKAQKTRQHKT